MVDQFLKLQLGDIDIILNICLLVIQHLVHILLWFLIHISLVSSAMSSAPFLTSYPSHQLLFLLEKSVFI